LVKVSEINHVLILPMDRDKCKLQHPSKEYFRYFNDLKPEK
jgi:hypothetical protein